MAEVIWTIPALEELDEIADYISLDNPEAAKKLAQEVFKAVDHLQNHPKSGKITEFIETSIYREVYLRPCRVFYRIDGDSVFIIHVIREEQFLHFSVLTTR